MNKWTTVVYFTGRPKEKDGLIRYPIRYQYECHVVPGRAEITEELDKTFDYDEASIEWRSIPIKFKSGGSCG